MNQFFKILTSDNINLCSTYSPSFISKMPWKTEEKAFIISTYFRLNSIRDTQLEFRKKFGTRDFSVCSLIYAWINKFKAHGTVKTSMVKIVLGRHTQDDPSLQDLHQTLLLFKTRSFAALASRCVGGAKNLG